MTIQANGHYEKSINIWLDPTFLQIRTGHFIFLSDQWNPVCAQNNIQTEKMTEFSALTYTTPSVTAPGPLRQSKKEPSSVILLLLGSLLQTH
jgi:hypothetical protein